MCWKECMVISLDRPPTPDDLAEVGRCLAFRPPAAAPDLGRLVAWAECLGVTGAAVEVLLDPSVPDVVRARAFAVVSSQVLSGDCRRARERPESAVTLSDLEVIERY